MTAEQATYSHGHHASVVGSHAKRTAINSAAFLLPHITPTAQILDVGCGPGSITVDLAELAINGKVIGVDASGAVLEQARSLAASRNVPNVTFETIDANAMPYESGTFDVVFCHQLLQHVQDPVGIMREMRRVCKPGGIVAARESVYSTFAWYPEHSKLDEWRELYLKQARANGGEPDGGKFLHAWAFKAGFEVENIESTVTSWCYTGDIAKEWGKTWSARTLQSRFASLVTEKGFATENQVQAIGSGWQEWSEMKDLWFMVPSGEILYRVPS